MEAITYKVLDSKGSEVGSANLNPSVFGVKPSKTLVHETVRWQRARKRAGTHSTLSRSFMKGGSKKPWKQKGTGRARAGSGVSPLWVGGAVVFGPKPRDYDYNLPKRTRRQALTVALSDKLAKGTLLIVNELKLNKPKTADMVGLIDKLGLTNKKALIVFAEPAAKAKKDAAWLSCRNIVGIKPISVDGLNVYDVVNSEVLVLTQSALSAVEERLK